MRKGRYSKRWWRGLTKNERRLLVGVMMARSVPYGGYGGEYPDDCSECGSCGEAMLGTGLCSYCYSIYETLHKKADSRLGRLHAS